MDTVNSKAGKHMTPQDYAEKFLSRLISGAKGIFSRGPKAGQFRQAADFHTQQMIKKGPKHPDYAGHKQRAQALYREELKRTANVHPEGYQDLSTGKVKKGAVSPYVHEQVQQAKQPKQKP